MPTRCEVCKDKIRPNNKFKKKSFHRFPLVRPEVLEKWILFVGRQGFIPKNYHRVCSDHFTENSYQFRPFAQNKLLKDDAVPTLKPYIPYWEYLSSSSSCLPNKHEHMDTDSEQLIKNMVVVSDPTDYKNVLNSHTDANRRIVISSTSNLKPGSGSSLANAYQEYQASAGSSFVETYEVIDVNDYKKDPLAFCDDMVHTQKVKEMEEDVKTWKREKRRWQLKIRRGKLKFKNLRKEFFLYTRKDDPLLRCNSQPVVHFLALDVQNA